MSKRILVNAVDPEECRIAIVKNNNLEGFFIDTAAKEITRGNVAKGVIARVEPSLQAVFVDYGAPRHGFLQKNEIHSDYFLDTETGGTAIDKVLKPGMELLVQITKDPVDKKGAMLTTYISLAGRFVVLMPGSKTRGVSRKIEEEDERQRLKKILDSCKIPEGFGVIVRTVGKTRTKSVISEDIKRLLRLWKKINKDGIERKAPVLLNKERSLAVRSLRDSFTSDVTSILVDDPAVFEEVKEFMAVISPRRKRIVRLYKEDKPIFSKHQLEAQIASIFQSKVSLKSGGSIVITPTEALVSVDVNSGKSTKEASVEKTALKTNLEAAEQIARQLRLRDLGGLVVIDFIDMRDSKNRSAVEKAMRQHVKEDKARIKLGRISQFGLMEMSRQRLSPPIEYGSYMDCPHCKGRGKVPSPETAALDFLRKLRMELSRDGIMSVEGRAPVNVADYLQNRKRKELAALEEKHEISLAIKGDDSLLPGESHVKTEK